MNLVNLTPHAINLIGEQNISIEPSGIVARCSVKQEKIGNVNGLPVYKSVYGLVEGLPEQQENTLYIVSGLVLSQSDRKDLVAPCNFIRDREGKIIGAGGLTK